ncbi:uncharacterized protein LOC120562943 isoform X1 [Perca fluviatilis]|uniref:uncharacterized protein LOC120562943 isoform X1 n=1 Tax=Perca fluviatilis TaxID=8168 RepID=UPI0019633702|nr:uncharacterized protein LOC120562943 isoform X1 [Perca fluviatilis]XP_039662846.1 uncharacterized protein LOC120562943 isoform X2 [Perca fluviatilis]XP_039662854.1 uncharacterized protein LOC120562943 isoform X1 [Perca fluviatilis]
MAGLCWLAVVLAFFMSDSLTAMEQDRLASIIQGIKNEYDLGDTFSLAVNIPQDQDINDLQQVFQDDPADKVKQTVSEGQVYQGTRVVAAAQPEALSRVLGNLQPLFKRSKGHFLLIYSEESPCGPTCTTNENKDRITGKINEIIQNWGSYAFVFSKVHDVPGADTPQLAESFKQLGVSKLGLDKVFRCYKPDDSFQCTSCLSDGDVTPACVANDVQSNQEQGVGGEEGTVPSTGTDTGKEKGEGMREDSNTGEEMAEGTGEEIATGEGGGTTGGKEKGKGGQVSKGRGSGKVGNKPGKVKCKAGGKRGKGCKVRRIGGGKRGKGGKVGRRGGGKRGKGGKVGRRGGGKRGKGGKVRRRGGGKRGEEVARLGVGEGANVEKVARLGVGEAANVEKVARLGVEEAANVEKVARLGVEEAANVEEVARVKDEANVVQKVIVRVTGKRNRYWDLLPWG